MGLLSRHCGKHNHKLSTISPRNNKLANIPQVPLCKAILTPRTYFSTTAQEGLLYCHCGARLHKYKMSSKGEPSPRIIRTSHHNNKHLIHTLWWKPSINRLVHQPHTPWCQEALPNDRKDGASIHYFGLTTQTLFLESSSGSQNKLPHQAGFVKA